MDNSVVVQSEAVKQGDASILQYQNIDHYTSDNITIYIASPKISPNLNGLTLRKNFKNIVSR